MPVPVQSPGAHNDALYPVVAITGFVVGRFLMGVADSHLTKHSLLEMQDKCPQCESVFSPLERLPLVSYMLYGTRCPRCKDAPKVTPWVVPLINAALYLMVVKVFGVTLNSLAMIYFASILVTVCITDLKDQFIPQDITYPAILTGILYSACLGKDVVGALAGIGMSYIVFDFLAFYGLMFYIKFMPHVVGADDDAQDSASPGYTEECDEAVDEAIHVASSPKQGHESEYEEVDVLGGADAVLAALIAAFVGWQRLLGALLVGLFVGSLLGLYYRLVAMHKVQMLPQALKPAILGFIGGQIFTWGTFSIFAFVLTFPTMSHHIPAWAMVSAFISSLAAACAVVVKSSSFSKPFPLAPALALGGLLAIFQDPIDLIVHGGQQ